MHVNNSPGALPAVDARQLNGRLAQAAQQRRAPQITGDLQTKEAAKPKPVSTSPAALLPEAPAESVSAQQIDEITTAALKEAPEDFLNAPPPPSDPVQALLDSWNTNDPQNDLNGDGTVNVFDLFQLLSSLKPAGPESEHAELTGLPTKPDANEQIPRPIANPHLDPNDETAVTAASSNVLASDPVEAPAEPEESAPLTLDGLMAAWGEGQSQYDLNNDGTVNVFDLFQLLSSLAPGKSDEKSAAVAYAEQLDPALQLNARNTERLASQKIENLADRLVQRLQKSGFDQRPPANLSDIVGNMKLSDQQQQILTKRVAQHYPAGLGVSHLG